MKKVLAFVGSGLIAGAAAGFFLRPVVMPDDRVAKLETTAREATASASAQQDRAAELDTQLKLANAARTEAEQKLAQLTTKSQAELDAKAAADAAAQSKLTKAIDKSSGSVSSEGDEIRLQLVDKVLFKVGDDQLTDRGKNVLAKVGAALKELPDKQVWVQGHTDDTPIVIEKPKPAKKGAKVKEEPAIAPRFATNWELSAARALTVVHYLQDIAKVEPARLAALAFGQYRPVSRSNKAANRRIEIVLYPHRAVVERK